MVFGLDARKNVEDGIDRIEDIKPIQDIEKFTLKLREEENNSVDRNVKSVEYYPIKVDDKNGILAILIPESDVPPHQSIKEHLFFIRAGGNFHKPDVTHIENLFYKKLSPILNFAIKDTKTVEVDFNNRAFKTRSYLFGIKNTGRIPAKIAYIELHFNQGDGWIDRDGFGNGHHGLQRKPRIANEPRQDKHTAIERFVGGVSDLVYPNAIIWISHIKHRFHPESIGAFLISYKIYAENFVGTEGIVRVCGEIIEYNPEQGKA